MWAVLILAVFVSMACLPEGEAHPLNSIGRYYTLHEDHGHHAHRPEHDEDDFFNHDRPLHSEHGHDSHSFDHDDGASYSGFLPPLQHNFGIVSGYGRR
ncbi:protein catecholamines up-like [Homalodisca vitripennis]|uniref:protein catecholamines up-like n=1 Tax=Homalodisca vitripennis TaxID=197043 RepID=UPI001EEC3D83|nr:protein catecholamines up-like [Homalodisca vitripennis]